MKILISSCLLGENVRYDGENSFILEDSKKSFFQKELFMDILSENEIFSFCPEVSGGLSIPRIPCEIQSLEKPFKITTKQGDDFTINFLLGAKNCLDFCKKEDIKVALLKSKSPSCGKYQVYDGSFSGKLIDSMGFTAKLLSENDIKIFDEHELEKLAKYIKA